MWTRPITKEIREVVQLKVLKGAQYDIDYGVCCTWVPVSTGGNRVGSWPRTLKQTRLHLWVDHFTQDADPRQWISTSDGEQALRHQSQQAGRHVMERAPAWWQTVATPEGVLAEAQRQGSNRFDIHVPRARLIAAFTLARLGDLSAARTELSRTDNADELSQLLEKVPVPTSR
jgi:hypothetical protein